MLRERLALPRPGASLSTIPLALVALSARGGPYSPWGGPYAYTAPITCVVWPAPGLTSAAAASAAAASAAAARSARQPVQYQLPILWTDAVNRPSAPSVRHGVGRGVE